jgi:carboxypeptidase Taq
VEGGPRDASGLRELEERLREVVDLRRVAWVLGWDQWTYMPPAAAGERGRQLAAVERLAHEKFTAPETGDLLEGLRPLEEGLPRESYAASLVRVTRREYERETRKPPGLVAEMAEHATVSHAAWSRAREEDDFGLARPHLERRLELSRKLSELYRDEWEAGGHVADPLISEADSGMTAAEIEAIFSGLRAVLVPLVAEIGAEPAPDDSCLAQDLPVEGQLAFAEDVIRRFGYDFSRGRQDLAETAFMSKLGRNDVRITTRHKERDLRRPLFTTLHEAGHALYEQGIPGELDGTPLGEGRSTSLHESQSRLWENLVGRSVPFWRFFFPRFQEAFPGRLGTVGLGEFVRAVNLVRPSFIRTEADEVTYNLHVVMRFDFELALLGGELEVRDLPEAWRERMHEDLGVVPETDREGCLQDPHWYDMVVGGVFHGYALGNVISAQLRQAALTERPEITEQMEAGKFEALLGWLTDNVYRHGGKYGAAEVVELATGSPLSIEPFAAYLRSKYGELYGLVT